MIPHRSLILLVRFQRTVQRIAMVQVQTRVVIILQHGRDILIYMKLNSSVNLKGSFVIKTWCSLTGKLLWESKTIENLVVSGAGGYGRNLIIRSLVGDTTYPIEIDGAKIGTGTNTPADADTDLQTPTTLTGITIIPIANTVVSNDSVVISLYVTNTQLPNGVYTEFGLFSNLRLFSRALISPTFTKGSNQNTTVDYTITLSS